MPRFEHARQCFFHLSTCPQMLQHIIFKLRKSRFHLNFKCFDTSLFRTLFPDTALLLFRDFFRYVPIIATRSSRFDMLIRNTASAISKHDILFHFNRNVQFTLLLIISSKSSANKMPL